VVSYWDYTNGDLKVMHCNDVNCAGGGDSITSPDTTGSVGLFTSLALDPASGRPVVSYLDDTNGDLKVMRCNDANCALQDESYSSPDTAGTVGYFTSLELDTAARPVVSYQDAANGNLKVMHCNDVSCVGGGESITTPDSAGNVGWYTSLALDVSGRPVVSYTDATSFAILKVMHCDDVNCAGGGEAITSPDVSPSVGEFTSIALGPAGRPVVAYRDAGNQDLRVLTCGTPLCTNNVATQDIQIASLTAGWPAGPMGGACYAVNGVTVTGYFTVCDNNAGTVQTSDVCLKDGTSACTDDDPTIGSIRVALVAADYEMWTTAAPGHTPAPQGQYCNVADGVDAKCSFTHTPVTRPWFPWDLDGNGAVAGTDFFALLGKFGATK
jgi:hypothetical protein